ncbi:ATP-binding protein [Streptomyces mangrovisoli]|uniref:ATP-binding protein n=1 Tax=Streptomyces mangrovisoli TaxID=1428628 RepID=A0A1J4NWX2_9ACTN|nr:ATP-binding protein [Streptomyces mangrovisoli]OIJ65996.1 ATP-binding protein [Streptomyces mangrovisoli]
MRPGQDPGAGEHTEVDGEVPRTGVSLTGDGTDIARARHLAAAFLAGVRGERGLPVAQRVVDLTQLVVSELVTNARKYAPGAVLLELRVVAGTVEVVVRDTDPALPAARAADAGRVGQHGLEIVRAVAQRFEVRREPAGKRVIARIALADGDGSGDGAGAVR